MAEDFDPYRKWLGILPKDQPPNHYRLLGIELFESDHDVIEGAADRQMAHLRTFQAGPHSAFSQKLLNECSAARLALLDPQKRAEYDRRLRAKLGSTQPASMGEGASPRSQPQPAAQPQPAPRFQTAAMPVAKPMPQAAPLPLAEAVPVIDSGEEGPTSSIRRTSRKMPVWRQPAVLGTLGALVIFVGIAYALSRSGKPPTEVTTTNAKSNTSDTIPRPSDTDKPASADSDKSSTDVANPLATIEPSTEKSVASQADFEILDATWGTGDKGVNVTEAVRGLVKDNRLMMMVWSDLLGKPEDSGPGTEKKLRLRYRSRGKEYTSDYFEAWFVYLDGNALAAPTDSPGALELLEARYGAGKTFVDVLPQVRERLRNGRLAVCPDELAETTAAELGMGPHVFKVLWVRYRNSTGEHFNYAWNSDLLLIDSRLPAAAGPPVDLLKLIDLKRDVVKGVWEIDEGVLHAPGTHFPRLQIPYDPPAEYMLAVTADAEEEFRDIGGLLVVGGKQVMGVVDGFLGNRSGIQGVNGKLLSADNPTCRWRCARMLEQGRANTLVFIVRPDSVRILRDGAEIARWSGNPRTFSIPDGWKTPNDHRLSLQAYDRPFRVSKLELTPLKPERAPMLIAGESLSPMDVLKAIDLGRDRLRGDWQYDGQTLKSDRGWLQLPAVVPENYQLDVVAERQTGNECLTFTVPIAGAQGTLVVDGYGGKLSGLQTIDGKRIDANETRYEGSIFADSKPHSLNITVRKNQVRLYSDGKQLVDWTGDVSRLKPAESFSYNDRIYVGEWDSRYRLTKVKLRALSGDATAESPATLAGEPSTPSEMSSPEPAGPVTDLLKQIDVKRDAIAGDWQIVDGALVSPDVPFARLMLPRPPAPEYQVTIVGEKVEGNWGIGLAVVVDGHQAISQIDGFNGNFTGLEALDGKDCHENETARQGRLLVNGKPVTLVYTVRRNGIKLTVDGNTVIDWHGDPERLSMIDGYKLPDPNRLALCEFKTICRISKIEIVPLSKPDAPSVKPRQRIFPDWASNTDTRLPEPDAEAQKEARKTFQKKYASARKGAKTAEQRRQLAQELAQKAAAEASPDADTFVLFKEAIDLAEAAGEIDLAWQTIDQCAKTFKVDALALRNQSLVEIGKTASAKSPERAWQLTDAACRLMTSALAAGDAAAVKKAAAQAQSFSKRTNDKTIQKEVNSRATDAGKWAAELEDVAKARETLKTSADGPAANFTVGHYELCVMGDFDAALPKLAKSSDAAWKKLASDELALANRQPTGPRTFVNGRLITRSEPAEAQRELTLADAWWSRAEEEPWPATHYLRMRAAKWYSSAYRSLVDTGRTRAAERLKVLLATDDGFPHWELFNRPGFQQDPSSGELVQIDSRGGLETAVEYGGPIDVTLSVRTTGTEVRLGSHNWSWNWNFKVLPNQWHTVRFIVNPLLRSAIVDGVPVQNETSQTPRKLGTAPVSIRPWNDEVMEVRKFIVKGT